MDQKLLEQLKQIIKESNSILITSHIGPDGDSVSSSLLLYKILKFNFPDKKITVSMEEAAPRLGFIEGYSEIDFKPLAEALNQHQPDLMIILDAGKVSRLTRAPEPAYEIIRQKSIKTIIIDHHEPQDKDEADLYINQMSPAIAQDIYELFIDTQHLSKPDGYAQIAIVGIYTDTGGFIYQNADYKKTFSIVANLLEDGVNLEEVVNHLNQVSQPALEVLNELISNTKSSADCTYTFLSDDFIAKQDSNSGIEVVREGAELYRSTLVRNIVGRPWGFVIYRDLLADNQTYTVSFRALSGTKNVQDIAVKLGGGGHIPAAGAKIEATSLEEALQAVKDAAGLIE
jgi:phosphoesterase RecJ-like protein